MRALIVSQTPPQPGQTNGRERRNRLFVRGIAQHCDQIDFLHFAAPSFFEQNFDHSYDTQAVWGVKGNSTIVPMRVRKDTLLNHYISGIFSVAEEKTFFRLLGPEQMAAARAALATKPDLVFVDQLRCMQPVLAASPTMPVLFDMDDIIHRVQWRMATTAPFRPAKLAYAAQVPAILLAERRAVRRAMITAVCSEQDRRFIAALGAGERAVVIPNAIEMPSHTPPIPDAPTVLLLGYYAHEPNRIAAEQLIRTIWPLIRRECANARLLLAGSGAETLRNVSTSEGGIEYLSYVDDLAGLYAKTHVVCCPLTVGGGTRLKLIEAAAFARPMVSTRIGAEGLAFIDGTEILIRDTDSEFAAACISLLQNVSLSTSLGTAARIKMASLYQASIIADQIAGMVNRILRIS
jgi:glycosyltransferase involved in cell wall biosynthesis